MKGHTSRKSIIISGFSILLNMVCDIERLRAICRGELSAIISLPIPVSEAGGSGREELKK